MESVVLVYAGLAAAFWGGVLVFGFKALRGWREERRLDRESRASLDARLARLEVELGAVRKALTSGSTAHPEERW